jgi:hypothetical protein
LALDLHVEVLPAVSGGDEELDGLQKTTANSKV